MRPRSLVLPASTWLKKMAQSQAQPLGGQAIGLLGVSLPIQTPLSFLSLSPTLRMGGNPPSEHRGTLRMSWSLRVPSGLSLDTTSKRTLMVPQERTF